MYRTVTISLIIGLLLLLAPLKALSKTLVVAVIDTGVDQSVGHLCKMGHKDFSGTGLSDTHGHGTHIAGLISKYAGNSNTYCIVNIKFYSEFATGEQNLRAMKNSIRYAVDIKADYINISGGGVQSDSEESSLIKSALNKGIHVVVAAGNEAHDLDRDCNYYPACYDKRLTVVGNLSDQRSFSPSYNRAPSSNYGHIVNRWEVGTNVDSNLPHGKHGTLTGTSQATAIATGKLLRLQLNK